MRDLSRRDLLVGIGAAAAAGAVGCSGDHTGAQPDATASGDDAPAEPDASSVNACTAASSMTAEQLLAHIETIVVLCMENRSFDHYLGSLRLVEGRADIDGLTGSEMNMSTANVAVPVHQLDDFTPADPPHGWDACHAQWNGGANDGFVKEHAGSSEADVMGYHVRSQIPTTYALADAAAICHRWFAGCLGPTWPNRFFLHGGTSNGVKSNLPALGFTSIFDRLAQKNITATNYYSDVAWASGGYGKLLGLSRIEQFFEQAMAGTLPQFSIIDPAFTGGGANDDHPDHDIHMGQALIASIVAALGQSPQWSKCLFVITYDEHGGFFDHVPPPSAVDDNAEFQQLGFRVPALVLGPTVRRGCAIDTVFDHSSVIATATKRWGLAPMTMRSQAANDLSPCIDPLRIGNPLPPPVLPSVKVSQSRLAERQAKA
ncbi:MAG TPA: alkaline phosphatase family protein, partial [Kofleriaceae bacterium]|nr:alkaline phosphatase family protein [Kofleriaceae bacterium]